MKFSPWPPLKTTSRALMRFSKTSQSTTNFLDRTVFSVKPLISGLIISQISSLVCESRMASCTSTEAYGGIGPKWTPPVNVSRSSLSLCSRFLLLLLLVRLLLVLRLIGVGVALLSSLLVLLLSLRTSIYSLTYCIDSLVNSCNF